MPRILVFLLVSAGSTVACKFDSSGTPFADVSSETSDTGEPTSPSPTTTLDTSTGTSDTASEATTGTIPWTTSSGDETTAPPAVCGNSIVEAGETCDDGFEANSNGNSCTSICKIATCGDGYLQPANAELCDDGPHNVVDPGYEQCSTTCAPGPHCGDGVVQKEFGEDCEMGRGELENCSLACIYQPRFIFLSSQPVHMPLLGVAGADAACNSLAAASPTLTGTYRAWLLVDGQSLTDRFPEFTALEPAWTFRNLGGDILAKSFNSLTTLGPDHPIFYTEHGDILAETTVWTNITKAAAAAGGDCGQWTLADPDLVALVGHSGFNPDEGSNASKWHTQRWWTDMDGYKIRCDDLSTHLYCVQVAD